MKSMKFFIPALLAGFMAVTMFACSKSNNDIEHTASDSSLYKINILAAQFSPDSLNMLPGSKIGWTNKDMDLHSVVADDGISFNSGNITAGATYNFRPASTGLYRYHCGIHPTVKGVLLVVTR